MYNIYMNNFTKKLLEEEKIEYYGIIPFSSCRVINEPLLKRTLGDTEIKSAIMLAVPYFTGKHERNISLYAVPKDYHIYFKELFGRIIPKLKEKFPDNVFYGFADSSPISETYAAALCGLGVIGDNIRLITEKYGSYVFIGEILTDLELERYGIFEIKHCRHCGKCKTACPVSEGCLSEMTQRKGKLADETAELIKNLGTAWGCDICQDVCPMNEKIKKTPIEFFTKDLIPNVSSELINKMTENEFSERAYSWRGRKTILRNLALFDTSSDKKPT